jgi:hypothetical protein
VGVFGKKYLSCQSLIQPDRTGKSASSRSYDSQKYVQRRVARSDSDLEPVGEFHTENEFWQLVVTVEAPPTSLRGFDQLEDHCECGAVR